ncbi:MAG: A/G-specific adenine glycosylase [Oscillospiraceae bacterium]|nr:A/G-specific adenine glycosylase [Oscillospiraceae bacterium]
MNEQTKRLAEAAEKIIAWCGRHRRPLPWREDPTPYRVWVSEIMLQQTRVETVIPYYERFMRQFPTVKALAEAPEEQVLKAWEGLGYYGRARRLKKAAEKIAAEYGGELPRTAEELRALPGIGDYTAGAVASLACGQPEPAVDGNVLRVLARLFASDADVLSAAVRKRAEDELRAVYPKGKDAALLTEGLMELGETVCTVGEPACVGCPLASLCLAREQGRQGELPVRNAKIERPVEERTVLILVCGEKRALRRRGDTGLLAGLWELPNFPGRLDEAALRRYLEENGLEPLSLEPLGEAKHVFTHREWHMTGYRVTLPREAEGCTWETPGAIRERYAVPSAFRAFMKKL